MDVVYDHFLAEQWLQFDSSPLEVFAKNFYTETEERKSEIPQKMQRLFQLMQEQNWLVEYGNIEGLERILFHMNKRTSFPSAFPKAVPLIEANKPLLFPQFKQFYKELEQHCKNHLQLAS